MATERYDKRIDPAEWQNYFRLYADILLPHCKGKVLDIGCGQGWLTKEIAARKEVDSIIAIDKFAQQPEENQDSKILYLERDIPSLPIEIAEEGMFDTIISTEFVEHITQEDLENLLPKIYRWLKDDGQFLGSTPNKKVPTINPYHLREYTLEELQELYERYGFYGDYELPRPDLTVWTTQK